MVMRQAMAIVPQCDPFFGHYLESITMHPREGLGTLATDCVSKIFYDPAKLNAPPFSDPAFLACVIVHELMHILRNDGPLFTNPDVNRERMNIATDAIINRDLLASGYLFPGVQTIGGFCDPIMSTGKNGPAASTSKADSTMSVYRDMDSNNKHNDAFGNISPEDVRAAIEEAGGKEAAREIVQRAAERAAIAQIAAGPAGNGESNDDKDSDVVKAIKAERALGHRLQVNPIQHVAGSKVRGILASRKTRRRSMASIHPLSAHYGLILPGRAPKPDVSPLVLFDVSGSITDEMIKRFFAECNSWVRTFVGNSAQIPVWFFDTQIVERGTLNEYRTSKCIPMHGGNTDFACWLEEVPRLKGRYTHILVWSDIQGSFMRRREDNLFSDTKIVWIAPSRFSGHGQRRADEARSYGHKVIASD
jgi:hypothetical protein